jgi:purine-nucleoside phosphorylase
VRTIGADAVGMSTVPEVIVARHMSIPCFAISIITDLVVPVKIKKVSVQDVIEVASRQEPKMTQIMKELISSI